MLINQRPAPSTGVTSMERPLPVWVGCLWQHGDEKVKEMVPAFATHRAPGLVLCDFWDPRTGVSRVHWMEEQFVRERSIFHGTPRPNSTIHPAAAPSRPTPMIDGPRDVKPEDPEPVA